jgi:hypothetical protein
VSEFKEERTQSGFIIRQMQSKLVGGGPGQYLGGTNIESVDEDQASIRSHRSGRSGRYGGRRPQSARSRGGSSEMSRGSSKRAGSPPRGQNFQ